MQELESVSGRAETSKPDWRRVKAAGRRRSSVEPCWTAEVNELSRQLFMHQSAASLVSGIFL